MHIEFHWIPLRGRSHCRGGLGRNLARQRAAPNNQFRFRRIAAIPAYVGGLMAMGFAADNKRLRQASARVIAERYRKAGRFSTNYWKPELQVGAFALPRFIGDLITPTKKK